MSAGKTVSLERLTEMVWSDGSPANSRRSLQNYAARLRSALGGRWVETRPNGFLLLVDADDVDALRFGRILDRAARAQDSDLERRLLDEALALSRGEPFEDVASHWLQEAEAPRLAERYLAALERRIDLDLVEGRSRDLVAELRRWTARCPLRESLWLRLLMVLDRQGRRAEALERYEELRIRLAEDLGVNPNAELQRLYAELLVAPPAASLIRGTAPRLRVIPRTIPAAAEEVIGRSAELTALSDLAQSGSAAVALVTGPAGTGKTAMAIHWAHSIADGFTDGQLYLDLRGSRDAPIEPAAALRTSLRALGVPADDLPSDLVTLAGSYRTLTADRRLLVLLDDARDAEQVRPLLPAGRACMTVITSRCGAADWDATDAVRLITLEKPPAAREPGLILPKPALADPGEEPSAAGRLFGTKLRPLRKLAALTQEVPAEQAVLGARALQQLETGIEAGARDSLLRLLAEMLRPQGNEPAMSDLTTRERPVGGSAAPTDHVLRAQRHHFTVPRQLPADVADFVGRADEVALLDDPAERHPAMITVIEGMAGVGKTALALHAAHRLAARFPDGQLFVNLHGHTADRAPVHPQEVLHRMLSALGVPGHHIPHPADDRAGLLRSLLAGHKILIMLDDAVDEKQVLPLLPGSRDCRVLITSRRRLAALDGTRTVSLDVLPPADAITLFTRAAGSQPIVGTPAQLVQTVMRCGLLPLAIRLAATRLSYHPAWDIAHLLTRLTEPHQRLTELAVGNRSIAATLDQAYRKLPEDQRRAYRLLGSRTTADIPAETAAALLNTDVITAELLLEQLAGAHLLQEPEIGLYRMHELLRDHATQLMARENGTTGPRGGGGTAPLSH